MALPAAKIVVIVLAVSAIAGTATASATATATATAIATPRAAGGNEPTLTIVPDRVTTRTLPPARPILVDAYLKAGDAELSNISISIFSNDSIDGQITSETAAVVPKMAARSEHSWRLRLSCENCAVLTESLVQVRAAFDVAQDKNVDPIHRLIYTTVTITPQPVVAGIALATAEIRGLPEALAHERPGRLFVTITNEYSRKLKVESVKFLVPSYVEVKEATAATGSNAASSGTLWWRRSSQLPAEVLPGQTLDVIYGIQALSEVVPGKYTLIAVADVTSEDGLTAVVRTTPQDLNIVVLGESDILKFLGIPSLLFLPGVLMLLTWRLLRTKGKRDAITAYPIQANTAEFWILGVALSLLAALVYPWLTERIPDVGRRNFVAAYGLLDFGLIVGGSLVATALAFGLYRAIDKAIEYLQKRKLAASTPDVKDLPLPLLDKLAKFKRECLFEERMLTGGDAAERLLAIEPWSDGELWLVPPAELTGVNRRNYTGLNEYDRIITGQILDAEALAETVRQGIDQGWWTDLAWRPVGDVQGPMKVQATGWSVPPGAQRRARLIQGD